MHFPRGKVAFQLWHTAGIGTSLRNQERLRIMLKLTVNFHKEPSRNLCHLKALSVHCSSCVAAETPYWRFWHWSKPGARVTYLKEQKWILISFPTIERGNNWANLVAILTSSLSTGFLVKCFGCFVFTLNSKTSQCGEFQFLEFWFWTSIYYWGNEPVDL